MKWVATESRANATLRADLAPFARLARGTHHLVAAGVNTGSKGRTGIPSRAARVQARLLLRLSHDLRVVELAAFKSYSLQALSLSANIFELSNTVAYIGTSDDRALAWEQHRETRWSYPGFRQRREAIRATLLAVYPGMPNLERAIEEQERLYTTLCMAKHGNPIVLKNYGATEAGDTVRLFHGPFVARYIVRQCRFALFHAARMTAAATMVFAAPMLTGAPVRIRTRYRRLERSIVRQISNLTTMALEPRT
jgi:hypothetical protein